MPKLNAAIHPRTLIFLLIAGALGSALVIPYFFTLFPQNLLVVWFGELAATILLVTASSALTLACVYYGLLWGTPINLGAPRLQNWAFNRADPGGWAVSLEWSIPLAVAVTGLVWVSETYWFAGMFTGVDREGVAWKRLAAALYGGTAEEMLLRLFAMSGFVRLFLRFKVSRTNAMIAALFLSAAFSWLFHAPPLLIHYGLTWPVVGRSLIHHGFSAMVFGWLYWRRGIEASMIAHGLSDLLLRLALGLL